MYTVAAKSKVSARHIFLYCFFTVRVFYIYVWGFKFYDDF